MDNSTKEWTRLEGSVSALLFRNDENGYTVLRMDNGTEEEVTVVGCMPGVSPGESLIAHGTWERHSVYGQQFRAEVVERKMPSGERAVFAFLSSGAVKGIGAATARRLLETFGEDVLDVMQEHPEQLTKVRGITRKRALAICDALRLQLSMRRLLDFLNAHQLPLQVAMPLYRRFGDDALHCLQDNPYLLLDEGLGVSFSHADALARSMEFPADHPLRLEAALLFTLSHNLDNGHVFLPRRKLRAVTAQLLALEETHLEEGIEMLTERGRIVQEEIAGEEACYLTRLYDCEVYVAERLRCMGETELLPPRDLDTLLQRIQEEQGMVYAPLQLEAVETAARRQILLLTGGPGTGKTTSLRGVLALFDHLGLHTALTAPTGRAAKRLSEACAAEASTIHRLLETRYDQTDGTLIFSHNEDEPLEVDAVIVDEASMVDLPLMRALLAALPNDCRLILVGDPHQLPSVGPGNLLSDLLRSEQLPTLRLREIFRQAAQSAIVRNAYAVDQGTCPDLVNSASGDFFFLRRGDAAAVSETIVELCGSRLPKKMGILPEQIQVLSPTRRGTAGTTALNQALQNALNPPVAGKTERMFGNQLFRTGDRVMQVKNNYDLLWETRDGTEHGMGVFNGDIGQIDEIDKAGLITVDFDGHLAEYTGDMLNQLEPAYAVTVHKSQGSEYRAVILSVADAPPMLLTRGVLYTAITRAKELLILVGSEQVVARMAENDRQQRRYSGLRARLNRR